MTLLRIQFQFDALQAMKNSFNTLSSSSTDRAVEEEIIEPLQDPVAERCADTLDACLEMRGGVRLTLEHAR